MSGDETVQRSQLGRLSPPLASKESHLEIKSFLDWIFIMTPSSLTSCSQSVGGFPLFMRNLTAFSAARVDTSTILGKLMNNELKWMWKEKSAS